MSENVAEPCRAARELAQTLAMVEDEMSKAEAALRLVRKLILRLRALLGQGKE